MHYVCSHCQARYDVTEEDLAFYDKVSPTIGGKKHLIPPPIECYDCRQLRRLAMRNERNLYARTCDLCAQHLISIYSPEKTLTVYCPTCWWGDKWSARNYGREYDFSRSFFEQFKELYSSVPKISSFTMPDNINSEYAHDGYRLKNCYLIFDGEQAQDSYYGELYGLIRDCCDFLYLKDCELCYECMYCNKCFDLRYSRHCNNCSSSSFLLDCNSCKNCIGCTNLVQREYCIFNEPYSREEFERLKNEMKLDTASGVAAAREKSEVFFRTQPRRATRGYMNEDISGDNLTECKNTHDSFDCMGMRDCRYCTNCMMGCTDCYDLDAWGDRTTLAYNSAYIGAGAQQLLCCFYVAFGAANMCYSIFCMQGGKGNLFGCDGVQKEGYCILNKQYTKEEYEALLPKVIEHMQRTGEWAQFFPIGTSPFAYNETVAQDFSPLVKEEVLARGWQWKDVKDDVHDVAKTIDASQLPDAVQDIPDDILQWAIRCEVSGRPYKIQKAELELYRRMGIPIPHKHFEVRHAERIALRSPRHLWDRVCAKCGKAIRTTYGPERPEKVYCEECYLETVY